MNILKILLPLVKANNQERFLQQHPGPFVVRQCNIENENPSQVQTPASLPINLIEQTKNPTTKDGPSSSGSRVLTFNSEEAFYSNFSVDELRKNGRSPFPAGVTLGRAANNDIVILTPTVSKFHCWIQRDPTTELYSIFDAGSSFGVVIGSETLKAGDNRPLVSGTKFKLGDVSLTFLDSAGAFQWIKARLALLKQRGA